MEVGPLQLYTPPTQTLPNYTNYINLHQLVISLSRAVCRYQMLLICLIERRQPCHSATNAGDFSIT